MKIDNNLIFDVGMHIGEDTSYYLTKRFRVIGIDANPNLVESAKQKFSKYLDSKQLVLLNFAVSRENGKEADFYMSENTGWGSLEKSIAYRENLGRGMIKTKTKKLSSVIEEFGVPYYCKIDIEGYDGICLETLSGLGKLPKFVSVETECLGEFEDISDEQALATLDRLHNLGYSKFKLVDQRSLCVLRPKVKFYGREDNPTFIFKILRKLFSLCNFKLEKYSNRIILSRRLKYDFPLGATGPFGEDLGHRWLDFETAKETLLFHRKDYFNLVTSTKYGFWCDWHAKL